MDDAKPDESGGCKAKEFKRMAEWPNIINSGTQLFVFIETPVNGKKRDIEIFSLSKKQPQKENSVQLVPIGRR
jgi:hypothetical protein